METTYNEDPSHQHSTLPEPKPFSYQHSTLPEPVKYESQAPGAADTAKESYFVPNSAPNGESYGQAPRRRSWTRWPFLLLFGLLLAIIAGLIGGFIGKAIEGNKHHESDHAASAQVSACSSAAPSSPTSSSTANALVIPKTGCPDTSGRTFQTSFSNVTYKLYCNVDWIGSDIVSVWAPTISDCVEACNTVNQYGLIDKTCIGTTFVPAWTNRTLAVQRVDRPSNCFLKYQASGYPGNQQPEEIVVMCIEGKCPQS